MTAVLAREAFGAEFVGAERFLNTPTYGLPPQFLVDALHDCIAAWQAGTMEATSFDEPVRAGRAGYAALTGVPVDSVAMGGTVSAVLGLVAAAIPDGSRVATLPGEFTSTTFPFAAQARPGCDRHRAECRRTGGERRRLRRGDRQPGAIGRRRGARRGRAAGERRGHATP